MYIRIILSKQLSTMFYIRTLRNLTYSLKFCAAIAVLKKHYHDILKGFPSDHMTSLGIFCQVTLVPDATVDKIISCSTSQESNREILDALIDITAIDGSLTKFCNAVEEIVGSTSPVVELLKSGKSIPPAFMCMYVLIQYVCTYNYVYVRMCHMYL